MKNLNANDVLARIPGMVAKVVGPFLVFDFTGQEALFYDLELGEHGMESVPSGHVTEPHTHEFVSMYKSVGLNLRCDKGEYQLPEKALIVVFPHTTHSWIPKVEDGAVGSCDSSHQKQKIVLSAAA